MSVEQDYRIECYLPLPRARAFELLVDSPETWWPSWSAFCADDMADAKDRVAAGNSKSGLNGQKGSTLVSIEPYPGGACYETVPDGSRIIWGTVLSVEKPLYIRLAWQVSFAGKPVMDPAAASRVVISFRSAGDGTLIELIHSDFIRHGDRAEICYSRMASERGWPALLERFQVSVSHLGAGS